MAVGRIRINAYGIRMEGPVTTSRGEGGAMGIMMVGDGARSEVDGVMDGGACPRGDDGHHG